MAGDFIIELKNAAIYQQDYLVLSSVNMGIKRGELAYIIGKVGSGKTSLIKTFNAELPLQEGSGYVAGYKLENIAEQDIPYLRRKLGIVFQDFQLLGDRTVDKNLNFVLEATGWRNSGDRNKRIEDALAKVDMQNSRFKMPHELSGGEQQRVVIARALLNEPEIILADEPTGNLDPDTAEHIMEILTELRQNGRTVVIVTHNYDLIRRHVGRVFRCEGNKLVEKDMLGDYIDFEL